MAVVPLLLDLPNVDDSFYGLKARVLIAMGGVLALALFWGRPGKWRTIDPPLALYAAAVVAAVLTSVAPLWSLWGDPLRHEGAFVLLTYAAVAAAASRLSLARATLLTQAMVLAATLEAVYGIAQYYGIDPVLRDPVRAGWTVAFGTTGNRNWLGGYMVMLLPLAVAFVLSAAQRWVAAGWAVCLGILHTALLCTLGRTAWIGAVVALGAMVMFLRSKQIRIDAPRGALVLALLGMITTVFFLPSGPFAARGGDRAIERVKTLAPSELPDAMGVRGALWRQTLPLIAHRPLFGYGPETFRLVFPQAWTEEWQRLIGPRPHVIDKAHNQLLDLAMSTGVVGVAGYLWAFAAMWRAGWRRMSTVPLTPALLVAGALAGTLGYLFQIEWQFSVVSVAPIYWCLVGLGAGLGGHNATQEV